MAAVVGKSGLELARKLLATRVEAGGFDRLLEKVKIEEAGEGKLLAELKVEKEHTNSRNVMHGAMTTLLVDSLSAFAMMTANDKLQNTGVSLNINMTFIKPISVGKEILIRASTDKIGSRIAFLNVDILSKADREIFAKGSHTKFVGNAFGVAMMTANDKLQNSGVSLNINMTFMKAISVGQEILIIASTDKIGSRVAFLNVEILSKASQEIFAKGSHTKFVGSSYS